MGRVVKGHGHVVPKVILDARGEASALLADARAEAEALRAETAAAHEAALREGFETGRADGVAAAAVALAMARSEAARLVEAAAPTAIALAAKMAEKIVGRVVALAPETMAEIAGEALAACRPGPGTVRVRIHPHDLAAVEARRASLAARAPAATLELVADEAVGVHGCVIETPQGRVDARLETQLAALERALTAGSTRG
ncbi:MAG TPA: FliH/SctL family protein [Polyangia bacterium]|jgi:flagellar biosynthesis/type III secretory pathway protein FliH|nr:FliH/SctL family protein [Polyangia bacterium]